MKTMNEGHRLGKMRNRLKRCGKRLSDKELGGEQRARIVEREAQLRVILKMK